MKRIAFTLLLLLVFMGGTPMAQTSPSPTKKTDIAYVAAGCFWCIQKDIDKVKGVLETSVGYIGGTKDTATYETVSDGNTAHYEALRIVYDPDVISYAQILDVVWVNLDPFNGTGQFCDQGSQYRAAIFPRNEEQKAIAHASKDRAAQWLKDHGHTGVLATNIIMAQPFYDAEDYHQKYYQKKPNSIWCLSDNMW